MLRLPSTMSTLRPARKSSLKSPSAKSAAESNPIASLSLLTDYSIVALKHNRFIFSDLKLAIESARQQCKARGIENIRLKLGQCLALNDIYSCYDLKIQELKNFAPTRFCCDLQPITSLQDEDRLHYVIAFDDTNRWNIKGPQFYLRILRERQQRTKGLACFRIEWDQMLCPWREYRERSKNAWLPGRVWHTSWQYVSDRRRRLTINLSYRSILRKCQTHIVSYCRLVTASFTSADSKRFPFDAIVGAFWSARLATKNEFSNCSQWNELFERVAWTIAGDPSDLLVRFPALQNSMCLWFAETSTQLLATLKIVPIMRAASQHHLVRHSSVNFHGLQVLRSKCAQSSQGKYIPSFASPLEAIHITRTLQNSQCHPFARIVYALQS